MAQYILRCSFACAGTRARCQGWGLSCGSGLLFAASSGAWWVLPGSRATCGAAPRLQQVLPRSVTRGWQHGALQAACFRGITHHTSCPSCCQPAPCHAAQQRDPEEKPCTQGGCPTTWLSDPELSTALQRQWGMSNAVSAARLVPSFPELPSVWDDRSPSPTTHIVF